MSKYAKGSPIPRTVGRCADLYQEVRALRLAMAPALWYLASRNGEARGSVTHLQL